MFAKDIVAMKNNKKISMLTAYDYSIASILNNTEIDMILVGDSLGNVILGYKDTIPVTVNDMIHHAKAVVKGAFNKFVIVDMPFLSVNCGINTTMNNVMQIMQQTGCHAVKIEGGSTQICNTISEIVNAGVPVMGHLGLTPQSYLELGGFVKQGTKDESAKNIIKQALELQKSGVFAIVLECIPSTLADTITKEIKIPTIGIGSGTCTDGQVLVINDMLGLTTSKIPSFVKKKLDLASLIIETVNSYNKEVK